MAATAKKLITFKYTEGVLNLSKSSIHRLADEDPDFPKPIRVGQRRKMFFEDEVLAYLASRIAERDQRVAAAGSGEPDHPPVTRLRPTRTTTQSRTRSRKGGR